MHSNIRSRVVSNFFLDGAKIIFGSLVIGVFLPNVATPEFPIITFVTGIALTLGFLILASMTAQDKENFSSKSTV